MGERRGPGVRESREREEIIFGFFFPVFLFFSRAAFDSTAPSLLFPPPAMMMLMMTLKTNEGRKTE